MANTYKNKEQQHYKKGFLEYFVYNRVLVLICGNFISLVIYNLIKVSGTVL